MQSAVLGAVDRADVVVVDDVDVFWGQVVVKVVLDAVDMTHVAHAVRHASHARVHDARVHLVLQPCTQVASILFRSCGKIIHTFDSLWEVASALSDGTIADPAPTTYRLATTRHDWHTIVRYAL